MSAIRNIFSLSCLLLPIVMASTTQTANAGIYNVQSILATEAEEGLSGAISGAVDWRKGNVNTLFLNSTPLARFRNGKHLFIGIGSANHKTSKGDVIISRFFEHLRYRYDLTDRVLGEVFVQHEFDAIKRIQLRALLGGGPKFEILQHKSYGLDIGTSYMLEYETLQDDGSSDAGESDLQHRNSTYLVGRYELDERVQFVASMYIQPRLTDVSDIRLLSENQLTFKITEQLSMTTSFRLAYDSAPPDTIKKLDTTLKSSLSIAL